MIAQLNRMIDDAHQAGLAYRRVIDRSVGLTDFYRPATKPRSGR